MNADELISDVIKRLHDPHGSAQDVAEAVQVVAAHPGYIKFIQYNLVQLLVRLGAGNEREVVELLATRLRQFPEIEEYFRSPYLATVAIGFELAKRNQTIAVT